MYIQFSSLIILTKYYKGKIQEQSIATLSRKWATLEIMKMLLKNKRSYQKCLSSANQPDEEIVMSDGGVGK
jgi:hypothetical protein